MKSCFEFIHVAKPLANHLALVGKLVGDEDHLAVCRLLHPARYALILFVTTQKKTLVKSALSSKKD